MLSIIKVKIKPNAVLKTVVIAPLSILTDSGKSSPHKSYGIGPCPSP